MFSSIKDKTTAAMASNLINQKLGQAGSVKSLTLDTTQKSMDLVIALSGEENPVVINLVKYSIHKGSDTASIQIESFRCSKPWVEILIEKYIKNRAFPLPRIVASVLC